MQIDRWQVQSCFFLCIVSQRTCFAWWLCRVWHEYSWVMIVSSPHLSYLSLSIAGASFNELCRIQLEWEVFLRRNKPLYISYETDPSLVLDTFCLEMLRGSTPVSCLDILQMDTPHAMLFEEKLSTIRDGYMAMDGHGYHGCRQYCLRIALLIFSDPWERWLRLQEEPLPWAMADVLQVPILRTFRLHIPFKYYHLTHILFQLEQRNHLL